MLLRNTQLRYLRSLGHDAAAPSGSSTRALEIHVVAAMLLRHGRPKKVGPVDSPAATAYLGRLTKVVARIESVPELFLGALLIGSLSRGGGDAISDIDLIAVTHPGAWQDAWDRRSAVSSGALVTFDRFEGKFGVAGHSWLTPDLVKVECLFTEPGAMRLAGNAVLIAGEDGLIEAFEAAPPFTRQEIKNYAAGLRQEQALPPIERAYDDMIALLRRDVLQRPEGT